MKTNTKQAKQKEPGRSWRTKFEKMTVEDYFGLYKDENALEKPLAIALETRKLEIELYWKRANYFWLIVAGIFVGYFSYVSSSTYRPLFALLLAGLGLIVSMAFYLANRGSKFWQVNWEQHVSLLSSRLYAKERTSVGIFSAILNDAEKHPHLVGPLGVSVSRVNDVLGLIGCGIWLIAIIRESINIFGYPLQISPSSKAILVLVFVGVAVLFLRIATRHRRKQFRMWYIERS